MTPKRAVRGLLQIMGSVFLFSCSNDSISNHYLVAEKLWTEKKYELSVNEFDQVVRADPGSAIALKALYRASMTRTLFLNDQDSALKGFKQFLERNPKSDQAKHIQLEIGEIYFSRLKQCSLAISHYQELIDSKLFTAEEQTQFHLRMARCQFLQGDIEASNTILKNLIDKPEGLKHKADILFQQAQNAAAFGEKQKNGYNRALALFQEVEKMARIENRQSLLWESIFQQACMLEELDQLDQAVARLKTIEKEYPSPNVIQIRLYHLMERIRKKQKS